MGRRVEGCRREVVHMRTSTLTVSNDHEKVKQIFNRYKLDMRHQLLVSKNGKTNVSRAVTGFGTLVSPVVQSCSLRFCNQTTPFSEQLSRPTHLVLHI